MLTGIFITGIGVLLALLLIGICFAGVSSLLINNEENDD